MKQIKIILLATIALIAINSCEDNSAKVDDNSNILKPSDWAKTTTSCGEMPYGRIGDSLRIVWVLPNPEGPDDRNEYYALRYFGTRGLTANVVVNDQKRFEDDTTISLQGSCDLIIRHVDRSASFNNSGDTLYLYFNDSFSQTFSWGQVSEGDTVFAK
jgi:hypothetical protein